MSLIVTKSDQEQRSNIIRGLISSKRRWNITEEHRQEILDETLEIMRDHFQAAKDRLAAIKTLRAMERDNQVDEWHEQKLAADAEKPAPQVNIHADRVMTVSPDAILGVLRIRQDLQQRKEVVENAPVCSSAQAPEGQSASSSE